LFENVVEDFDPTAVVSPRVAAMQALIDSKKSNAPVIAITTAKGKKPVADDLETQLAAALAMAKATKEAKAS
jgi:hypothetical protein